MTNKEDVNEQFDPETVALLAMHLVSQVLEDAYVIAKSAREAGKSWRYFTMYKNINDNGMSGTLEDIATVSKGDSNVIKNITDVAANAIVTSTPQKFPDEKEFKIEPACIGQGDEESEIEQDAITTSTSMFIQNLFDMSEVAMLCDDSEIMQKKSESKALPTQIISKINDSHLTTVSCLTCKYDNLSANSVAGNSTNSTENSEFSFLNDAFIPDICKEKVFSFKGEGSYATEDYFKSTSNVIEATELAYQNLKENMDEIKPEDTALNENIYLTLNRDYEQYSEDDGDPVLQDPKGLILQEVELLTAKTSDDNMSPIVKPQRVQKSRECLAATITPAGGSRKNTLVRRCRSRGSRLFSCLRSWWPFKTTKPKGSFGTIHGSYTLSTDARQRASCALDQRLLRSTTSSNFNSKFNTVNETIMNSTLWKDYEFENKMNSVGE